MVGYGAHQSARFMHCNDESAAAAAAAFVVCIGGYCVLRVEVNGCNKHPSSFNRNIAWAEDIAWADNNNSNDLLESIRNISYFLIHYSITFALAIYEFECGPAT